ncbi:MAG: PKD domain-containing protein [bacterium]
MITPDADQAATIGNLQSGLLDELQRELSRQLGETSERGISEAAVGSGNEVFSLMLEELPGSAGNYELSWTEVLRGDYDGNGQVNAADLVPLARHFDEVVAYRDPLDANGAAYWPAGNYYGWDTTNWERSRVDGNRDGIISLADVTTIAQHFGERLDGYRVYHSYNGADAELLPWPGLPEAAMSISRLDSASVALNNRLYSFIVSLPETGVHTLSVAPYTIAAGAEGALSLPLDYARPGKLTAEFSAQPMAGDSPLPVAYDASASTCEYGEILDYAWDFDGDGSLDQSGDTPLAEHTYETAGGFSCRLVVTDNFGRTAELSRLIAVDGAPAVSLSLSADEIFVGESIMFTAEVSPGLRPLSIRRVEVTGPDPSEISFSTDYYEGILAPQLPGAYQIRLLATDTEQGSAAVAKSLLVRDPIEKPHPLIELSSAFAQPDEVITADGSQSYSDTGTIVNYAWSAGGAQFISGETEAIASLSFPTGGVRQVLLTVTDDQGVSATADAQITIGGAPIAEISGLDWMRAGTTRPYSAASSIIFVSGPVTYDWDLDGDGSFETLDAGSTVNLTAPAGSGLINLGVRVTDNAGLSDTASLEIEYAPAPQAVIVLREREGDFGRTVEFDASGSIGARITKYRWSLQTGEVIETTEAIFEYQPLQWEGSMWVTLEIHAEDTWSKYVLDYLNSGWGRIDTDIDLHFGPGTGGLKQYCVSTQDGTDSYIVFPRNGYDCSLLKISTAGGSLQISDPVELPAVNQPLLAAVIGGRMHICFNRSGSLEHIVSDDMSLQDWSEAQSIGFAGQHDYQDYQFLLSGDRIIMLESSDQYISMRHLDPLLSSDWSEAQIILHHELPYDECHLHAALIAGKPAMAWSIVNSNSPVRTYYSRALDAGGEDWYPTIDMQQDDGMLVANLSELDGKPVALMLGRGSPAGHEIYLARAAAVDGANWSNRSYFPGLPGLPGLSPIQLDWLQGRPVLSYWNDCHCFLEAADSTGLAWVPEQRFVDNYGPAEILSCKVLDLDGYPLTFTYGDDLGHWNGKMDIYYPLDAPWAP